MGSKAPTFKGKLLALDLDTSPVIGAMGLILSKWRRLEIYGILEKEKERKRVRRSAEGKDWIRQTVPKEREGAKTKWSKMEKETKASHHFQK